MEEEKSKYVRTSTKHFKDYDSAKAKAKELWGERNFASDGGFTDAKGKLRIKLMKNGFDVVLWDVVKNKPAAKKKVEETIESIEAAKVEEV